MLVVVFLSGVEYGIVRECKDFECACDFITSMGEDRINKVVITDLQPTKTETKNDLINALKWDK